MTNADYAVFVERYKKLRVTSLDIEFVLLWRTKLDHFAVEDLLAAVIDVAADPRAGYPLNDLPLLVEYAREHRERRQPPPSFDYGPRTPADHAWDAFMLKHGVIDKKEFDRRERERNG